MAQSGLLQMLKMFGIEFDPEEIKTQAMQFKAVMVSIDNRLAVVQAQNAAIMRHLGITEVQNETGASPSGVEGNRAIAG